MSPGAVTSDAPPAVDAQAVVAELVARARTAQRELEGYDQARVDEVVTAVAWACFKRENAEALARLAVETTGLGRVEDKVAKNRRKTMGTLNDLLGAPSVGVIRDDAATGITEIAKPVGVVAAVCPSTNPAATPTNKAMMAVKGRNAVILAPSPKGVVTCELLLEYVHQELAKVGAPRDLVQALPPPISKELTRELMGQCDLVVATGSQSNVRAAYSSGTPAIGVGSGNVPVLVDDSADLDDAARKIKRSKVFDHATSCSSENAVLLHAAVYDAALAALEREGGVCLDADEKQRLQAAMWPDGKLSRAVVAQSPERIAEAAGLPRPEVRDAEFLMVEEDGVGPEHPFSGEKLSPVLTVYRFETFDEGVALAQRILDHQGAGHSVGIHTADPEHAERLAHAARVARVLVNQPHCFNNGGSFDNGLNFTLTMGCGTWAGNSISENLSYRHFMNVTRLVRVIPGHEPTEEELFGAYVARRGA
jgi:sulfoacetaldehyde dehydrogenase